MNERGFMLLGAEVYFEENPEYKIVTDRNGHFSFGNNLDISPGEPLHIHVSATGYQEYHKPVYPTEEVVKITVIMKGK